MTVRAEIERRVPMEIRRAVAAEGDGPLGVDRPGVGRRGQHRQQVEGDGRDARDEGLAAALGGSERDHRDEQHRGRPEVAGPEERGDGRDVEDRQHEPGDVDHQPLAGRRVEIGRGEGRDRLRRDELDADRDETPDVVVVADEDDRQRRQDEPDREEDVGVPRQAPERADTPARAGRARARAAVESRAVVIVLTLAVRGRHDPRPVVPGAPDPFAAAARGRETGSRTR